MARRLRIAVSVFFALVAVALVVLWVRSYTWSWWVYSLSGGDQVEIGSSPFCAWITSYDGTMEFSSPGATVPYTWHFAAPHWLLVLISCAFAVFPWIRWPFRFSLRNLPIVMTLVAVVLGLVVRAGR
jgi:hypothetical protein